MKLTGKVTQIRDTVAKIVDGKVEIKRGYSITVRPSSGERQGYEYGYGNMSFITHGSELTEFGVGLGDEIEAYLVRKGESAPNKSFEDVSAALYKTEGDLAALTEKYQGAEKRFAEQQRLTNEFRGKNLVLMQENVRLTTELETLKAARAAMPSFTDLKQIGPAIAGDPSHG